MQVLRKILFTILSLFALGFVLFHILKYNPKPDIISLERKEIMDIEIDKMAMDLVDQMSIEEKVQMMSPILKSNLKFILEILGNKMRYNQDAYQAGGNLRLNIPTMRFFDGPRGMVSQKATCFPVAMARAASFDRNLEKRVGQVIGKEIRANEGNYFGGVCINLLRHPAGGRAQESYGEDSYLLGQMGASLMEGVQDHNVMACIKHFALNNQENTRFSINVEADERVLREVYLPHFKECVDQGAASVMGAYNLFRGEQCCESTHLLTTILKEDWGFEGFTISDFLMGIRNTELAANAGLDVEMPSVEDYGSKLLKAFNDGKVSKEAINESAFRVVRTILKFESRPDPLPNYPKSFIGSEEHVALSLEAAERSMVLMQNKQNILPFNISEINKILVLGELASVGNIGDHGSSRVRPEYIITPMEGLEKRYGDKVSFIHYSGEDMRKTKQMAEEADAVIFVVGYTHDDEGEYMEVGKRQIGGDRKSIKLHKNESDLLKEIGPVNENSVAVLIGGSAIIVEEWKDQVNGIIHAFYPGMEGGIAIAKTIFGENNPGGKLPFTVASDESHYPQFDRLAEQVTYDRFHGYIKLDQEGNKASFPFGFGLSYTTFSMANPLISIADDSIHTTLDVTNTGNRIGDQVVQLYIGFENSKIEREHKLLKGFEKITLEPGETKTVKVSSPIDKIKWYNPDSGSWELEKMEYQAYVGFSSDEKELSKMVFSLE